MKKAFTIEEEDKLNEVIERTDSRFLFRYTDKELYFWGRVIFTDVKTFSSTSHGRLHC